MQKKKKKKKKKSRLNCSKCRYLNELVSGLTVLESTISNTLYFYSGKCEQTFAIHVLFSKNISIYAIINGQSFNDMLTNDIVSVEQMARGFRSTSMLLNCLTVESQVTEKKKLTWSLQWANSGNFWKKCDLGQGFHIGRLPDSRV